VHLVALVLAAAGMVAVWMSGPGMYLAMTCGILAFGIARLTYRQRHRPGAARLVAAGALAVAAMTLLLAAIRYAMTLLAIGKLESLLG
jgi:hypothetical protein